jgi:hypothetical protein
MTIAYCLKGDSDVVEIPIRIGNNMDGWKPMDAGILDIDYRDNVLLHQAAILWPQDYAASILRGGRR